MIYSILTKDVQSFSDQFELWEELRGKTFLITGATGLIGAVLIKCLLELNRKRRLGIKVKAVVRSVDKAKKIFGDDYYDIDLFQIKLTEINKEIVGMDADYIVHLASPTASKFFVEHPVETLRTAIEGTIAVLEYAKVINVKSMVYVSSLEVYGVNYNDNLIDENFQGYVNPIEVRSSYNTGKRACECLCHSYSEEYNLNVTIARFTQVFGAGISENENRVFAQFARSTVNNTDIVLHTHGQSSKPYCYTTDAISAILYLLLRGSKGEAYNVANKDTYISIYDLALFVKENFNPNINVVVSVKENMGYAPVTKLKLDTSKIESLGWKPVCGLSEMLKRLIIYLS